MDNTIINKIVNEFDKTLANNICIYQSLDVKADRNRVKKELRKTLIRIAPEHANLFNALYSKITNA